jgi:hypothetical protein
VVVATFTLELIRECHRHQEVILFLRQRHREAAARRRRAVN